MSSLERVTSYTRRSDKYEVNGFEPLMGGPKPLPYSLAILMESTRLELVFTDCKSVVCRLNDDHLISSLLITPVVDT